MMKYRKWFILLSVAVLAFVFVMYGMHIRRVKQYEHNRVFLSAEEVLVKHLSFWKNRQSALFKLTVSSKYEDMVFHDEETPKILRIESVENDEITYAYLQGVEVKETESFDVYFESDSGEGEYLWRYVLCKEQENSPWLVYAWGVDF